MIDATGKLLIELRDDAAFAAWHGDRVRGVERMPPTDDDAGDARGPGEYVRFACALTCDG